MKNKIKLTFLAVALGFIVSSTQAATYNGDLLIGFTVASGNDLVYDLGKESSLTNGETWDIHTLLTGYILNNVNWGVIGSTNISGTKYAWATYAGQSLDNSAAWTPLNNSAIAIYSYFGTAGAGQSATMAYNDSQNNSWDEQTIAGPLTTSYVNENGNPNIVGTGANAFYQYIVAGGNPTQVGTFSLSSGGIVTFNTISSGPPAPKIVAITRTNTTSTIFFTTTNGTFTYSLRYTNSGGLTAPTANWPVSPTTLTGNGLTNSLQDVTTASNRFYRVTAQ